MDAVEWRSEPDGQVVGAAEAPTQEAGRDGQPGSSEASPGPEMAVSSLEEAGAPASSAAPLDATASDDQGSQEGPDVGQETGLEAADADATRFQTELAEAMHRTASGQHERIVADLEARRASHIEGVRARAAAELEELRADGDREIATIDAWAEAEVQRIRAEQERRRETSRRELEDRVAWHGSVVEREIEGVEEALAAHRSQLETFFSGVAAEADPAAIASLAARVPAMLKLGEVGAAARARAVADLPQPHASAAVTDSAVDSAGSVPGDGPGEAPEETAPDAALEAGDSEALVSEARLVAVMDPLAGRWGSGPDQWSSPEPATTPAETEPAAEQVSAEREGRAAEAISMPEEAASGRAEVAGQLLSTVPVTRPFSWLARGNDRRTTDHQD